MKKASIGLIILAWAFPIAANADELPWWMGERRIIGDNHLEPIEDAVGTRLYDFASAVARVETIENDGFCTGSRVADDLFLTNHHCYDYKPCEEIQFRMGYEAGIDDGEQKVFKCAEVLANDLTLDYALYRVEIGPVDPTDPTDPDTRTHLFDQLDIEIPDADSSGVTESFNIRQNGVISSLKVHVKISHSWRGDLVVTLTSPSGTDVVLQNRLGSGADDIDREFIVPAVVGEDARGLWQLTVSDNAARDVGTLESVKFTLATGATEAISESRVYPKLKFWAGDVAIGQMLIVAGHPSARLKEIDRGVDCMLRTIEEEEVAQRRTITHTCDTEGGSSGSPVIDRDSGRIVALHWGGTNEYNLAIPIALVVEHMEENIAAEEFAKLTIER